MEDNSENIFVEFDYNNIVVVDPNRVINENGIVSDRFVKQENLVMYANLECKMIPRTKLVLGESYDSANIVSLATINFLKQQDKTFLDNSWTDEITGKDSIEGKGDNQVVLTSKVKTNDKKPDEYYISKSINTGGNPGSVNNGLLGIKSITIKQNTSFLPTISIVLEDIKGRALFELGDNSPYAAFFNLPYPKFFLTLKGYYGKAVRYEIMLQKFTSRYSHETGNFIIDLNFLTYKYTILSEITMGHLLALPHMYKTTVTTTSNSNSDNGSKNVTNKTITLGQQKLSEVYSEYKIKGLINNNLPEYSLLELKSYLDTFAKNVIESFSKQNLGPLSDIRAYNDNLNEYNRKIFLGDASVEGSWAKQFLDTKNFFVLNNSARFYQLKDAFLEKGKESEVKENLKGLIIKFNDLLLKNKTFGTGGTYVINNGNEKNSNPESSEISNVTKITYDKFVYNFNGGESIDIEKTWRQRTGSNSGPDEKQKKAYENEIQKLKAKQIEIVKDSEGNTKNEIRQMFFVFDDGTSDTFTPIINDIKKELEDKKNKIEEGITAALGNFVKGGGNTGIKFEPTLRNILSVFLQMVKLF